MLSLKGSVTAQPPTAETEDVWRRWDDHMAMVLGLAGVPDEFLRKGWSDFRRLAGKEDALDTARAWATGGGDKPGLLLYGPPGSGKSHLAAAAFRDRLTGLARQRGVHSNWDMAGRWCNVSHLLRDTRRRCFGDGKEDEQTILDDLQAAAVVVLDDIGVKPPSEWAAEFLYSVVDDRWTGRGATLVTSNLTPKGLVGLLGERVMSRLLGLCEPVEVAGDDMRRARPNG